MDSYARDDIELFVEVLELERSASGLDDPELVIFDSHGYNCYFQIDASGKKVGAFSLLFMGHEHSDIRRVVHFLFTLEKGDLSPLIAAVRARGVKVRSGTMDEVVARGLSS